MPSDRIPPPPSLADICCTFWGSGWEEHLADVLDVPIEQVQGWDQNPSTLPADLDKKLYEIGHRRLEQIMVALRQLGPCHLRR
jgi:hypothetical protein